ncbi:hypothetical protein OKW45_003708 [Paraburkholderia sp. WSM4175]|uniref:hypothetical protein n=1 Tax=Paraburkholderia sp. WSM4175 TaxID=2991072 RepID=UPI003D22C7D1
MKRSSISPSRWKLARVSWEWDEGVSYAELGRRLRVTRQAVYQHACRDGWARTEGGGDPLLAEVARAGLSWLPPSIAQSLAATLGEMAEAIGGLPPLVPA